VLGSKEQGVRSFKGRSWKAKRKASGREILFQAITA
jgi:hypothetical protein